jgi:ribosomal protein S18 acetylase RimI-like enzyme
MKSKIQILKAKPEDVKEIAGVYYKTWLATYPNKKYRITAEDIKYQYRNRNKKEALERRKEEIRHPKKNIKRFVAKLNKKVIGLCNVIIDDKQNQLKAIYVLPEYHGKGIGYMLWQKTKKYFNPKNKTIVCVATYNKKAIEFYKKLGFVKTGKHFKDEKFKMRNGAMIPEIEMILKKEK